MRKTSVASRILPFILSIAPVLCLASAISSSEAEPTLQNLRINTSGTVQDGKQNT
jgi:hypothetical protein